MSSAPLCQARGSIVMSIASLSSHCRDKVTARLPARNPIPLARPHYLYFSDEKADSERLSDSPKDTQLLRGRTKSGASIRGLQHWCPSHWPALPERQWTKARGEDISPAVAVWNMPPGSQPRLYVSTTLYAGRPQAALHRQPSPGLRVSGQIQPCACPVPRGAEGPRLITFSDSDSPFLQGASPGQPALAVVRLLPVLLPPPLALPLGSPRIRSKMPLFSVSALKRSGPCSIVLKLLGPRSLHCFHREWLSDPSPPTPLHPAPPPPYL